MSLLIHTYVRLARVALAIALAFGCVSSLAAQEPAVDETKSAHEHASTATDGRTPPSHAGHQHMEHDAKQHSAEKSAEPPTATGHVAPPPPQHPMESMDARQMVDLMEMDDAATFAMLKFDRLERADTGDGVAIAWKFAAWAGGDFDKLLVRSEGERAQGGLEPSDAEVLWSHAVAPYWDTELGVRHDFGPGPNRNWAAFGVQGLAPYWFEVGATAYVGDAGRTALRLEVDYELSLTQRLILQPRFELNAYGKDDPAAYIGSGLSDTEFGLRLRYEIRRQFAPYIGIEQSRRYGRSADYMRAAGFDVDDTYWVVGLRVWY